jgi:hypothetical protein
MQPTHVTFVTSKSTIMNNAFIEAVKNFSAAAKNLKEVWDNSEEAGTEDYPFFDSFDELVPKIRKWERTQIKFVKMYEENNQKQV